MSTDALLFRDNKFIAVEQALGEYATIQEYVHARAGLDSRRLELARGLPARRVHEQLARPRLRQALAREPRIRSSVVNVFEGVDSSSTLERCSGRCIEWVRHPDWDSETGGLEDAELEI